MRRFELATDSPETINEILNSAEVGHLGLVVADSYPRVVPVNFALLEERPFFHCAQAGEKWKTLQGNPRVTFNVYQAFSIIPSYWLTNDHGCGATHFFKSVQINGRARIVTDPKEKAHALQVLMEKYQPEGAFRKIIVDEKMYLKPIAETGIILIEPERVSCKVKVGGEMTRASREKLIEKLRERGEPIDLVTVDEIGYTLG